MMMSFDDCIAALADALGVNVAADAVADALAARARAERTGELADRFERARELEHLERWIRTRESALVAVSTHTPSVLELLK